MAQIHHDEYDETREANVTAVLALMESKGDPQNQKPTLDTFEQIYNYACLLIEKKNFSEALNFLDKAIGKQNQHF